MLLVVCIEESIISHDLSVRPGWARRRPTVVNSLDALDTGVVSSLVVSIGLLSLVPVKDSSNEGRDECDSSLGASDGLSESKEECQVAVDAVFALEFAGGLNTLPCRGDLDEDSVLRNADGFVKLDEMAGLYSMVYTIEIA